MSWSNVAALQVLSGDGSGLTDPAEEVDAKTKDQEETSLPLTHNQIFKLILCKAYFIQKKSPKSQLIFQSTIPLP